MGDLLYGGVLVTKGKHKGKNGYYDDDEGDKGVVYFGEPFTSNPVLIKTEHLQNITVLDHEKFKRANPEYCKKVDIC